MSMEDKKIDETVTVIAMKGHPGTGKSTLANAVALALKIPLLDKDDVRDCTLSLQRTLLETTPQQQLSSPSSAAASLLNDLSYDVVWRMAATQVKLGVSVVVDSPLSRRAHLERLVKVAGEVGAGVVIVECKPSDETEWRRRLERRGGDEGNWHKPSTWYDMERLLEAYGGCTEYDVGDVARLTVDTTASVPVEELVSSVVDFVSSRRRTCGPVDYHP